MPKEISKVRSGSQFGKRMDGLVGRRASQRQPVSIAVSMFTVDQSRVVILDDLSLTGAKISGHTLPADGQDVSLKLGQLDAFGRVVWSKGRQCGVTFDEPLAEEQLREVIRELEWEPPRQVNNRRLYELR